MHNFSAYVSHMRPKPCCVCVCVCALPISSMKMIDGCSLTANEKTAAASFWDSPYHLSVKVLGCRLMKRNPASLAVALAISVLPQPGGPYSSTPGAMMTSWRQFQAHNANKEGQHDNRLCTPTQLKTPGGNSNELSLFPLCQHSDCPAESKKPWRWSDLLWSI